MRSKGFTLIELAVVLAIIAVLAAVLTPMVTGYLDQARLARAQADVRTIADSIKLYQRDTGRWPVFNSSTISGASASNEIGTSSGNNPTGGSGWTSTNVSLGNTSLELYLNNDYTGVGTASFPKAGFRGPYIRTVDSDPWGNKYLINATDFTVANSANHTYVISAGPNGTLETTRDTASTTNLTAGGDDIISIIR